ncbi:MAG: hypothetical protein ACXWG0_08215, partial [Chthoniobacterales bacterium]
ILTGASTSSVNADPTGSRSRSKTVWEDDQERYVMVTGSNIPQKIKRKSIGTPTAYNLRIITHDELLSTGRQTVAGALSIDPSVTISGH